nr:MFS transporter [Corynebacterium heidelbergense]
MTAVPTEHSRSAEHSHHTVVGDNTQSILRQPIAVWVTAMATAFAFMGIGLVDPILPAIAENLHATAAQVSMLFTSYFAVTAVMMLITGAISSRIGGKATLLVGLTLIVVFAALSGLSTTVGQLVGFRAGWGVGNSLFVATALAVIVSVASGGKATAVILYEAALGVGMAVGPLAGALLGGMHWRAPFLGTAVLMAIAAILILLRLPATPKPAKKSSVLDPLRALTHRGLFGVSLSALFYYFGFFTILAFTPFILHMGAYGVGAVFFGWGTALAVFSVMVAPAIQAKFGTANTTLSVLAGLALVLVGLGAFHRSIPVVIVLVVISGALLGINNTMYTEMATGVSNTPQPIASAGYNFVRWIGGAAAPVTAAHLGEQFSPSIPYFVAAGVLVIALLPLLDARAFVEAHDPSQG